MGRPSLLGEYAATLRRDEISTGVCSTGAKPACQCKTLSRASSEVHHGGDVADKHSAACAAVQGVGLRWHDVVTTANVMRPRRSPGPKAR